MLKKIQKIPKIILKYLIENNPEYDREEIV